MGFGDSLSLGGEATSGKRMHFSVRFVRFVRCPCLLSALPLGKKPLIRPQSCYFFVYL